MAKYLTLAALGLVFAGGSTETQAGGCCVSVPKQCVPVLRVPPENYVPDEAMLSPPEPVPYAVWYYNLYETFCRGKAEKDCIWACAPVVPPHGVSVRASY